MFICHESVPNHTSYLSFFLHGQNFWIIKFTPKTPIFRVKSVKNATFSRKICRKCQFFALNLKKFTPARKIYTDGVSRVSDNYQVCQECDRVCQSITECVRVCQSVAWHFMVLHSIALYCM